jgi:hypothetical protein
MVFINEVDEYNRQLLNFLVPISVPFDQFSVPNIAVGEHFGWTYKVRFKISDCHFKFVLFIKWQRDPHTELTSNFEQNRRNLFIARFDVSLIDISYEIDWVLDLLHEEFDENFTFPSRLQSRSIIHFVSLRTTVS